jgi:hypothetical protein
MVTYTMQNKIRTTKKITSYYTLPYEIDMFHCSNEYKLQNSVFPSRILIYKIDLTSLQRHILKPCDDKTRIKIGMFL